MEEEGKAAEQEKRNKGSKGGKGRGKGGKARGKGKAKGEQKKEQKKEEASTTELHSAARNGGAERLKSLLLDAENAKEVNALDQHHRTPLHMAAFFGHAAAAQVLLENNADVASEAQDGFLPVHFAAQGGHVEVLRTLVRHISSKGEHGAIKRYVNRQVYKGKKSALHLALQKDHADCARFLVMKGASCELQTAQGQTALDLCKSPELKEELTGGAAAASAEAQAEGEQPAPKRPKTVDEAAERPGPTAPSGTSSVVSAAPELSPAPKVRLAPMSGLPARPPTCSGSAVGALAYGPLALDHVEVTAIEAERSYPSGVAALADVHWKFAVQETPSLSDGPVWCVQSYGSQSVGAEEARLSLTLQRSTYRLLLYTRLTEEGRLMPPGQQCPACGLTVLTETADGMLLFARKPDASGNDQAWRAVPGVAALSSSALATALEQALRKECLQAGLDSARLLGLLPAKGSEAHSHELVFGVRLPTTSMEVVTARKARGVEGGLLLVRMPGHGDPGAMEGVEVAAFEEVAVEGGTSAFPLAAEATRALLLLKELRAATTPQGI